MLDNEGNQNEQVKVSRRVRALCGISEGISSLPIECSSTMPLPNCPNEGLVVRVCYAGICYAEGHIRKGHFRPKLPGVEIAGIVQDISNSLPNCNFTRGDKVIIFPSEDMVNDSYQEFVAIENAENVIQIPSTIPMEIASMLPGSAMTAYNAVLKALPHIEKLQKVKSCVNVLIVGAGSVGLWTLQLANYFIGKTNINMKLFVADHSIDKLLTAQDHHCSDIIHWCDEDHEQYIVERTLDACRGGVDIVVDFIGSARTVMRSLKVLNREGLILLGGTAMSEVSINLNMLAAKQQSIVGIPHGTVEQLRELIDLVADGKVAAPAHKVYNFDDAKQVFEQLADCRLTGRAILRFGYSSANTEQMDNS